MKRFIAALLVFASLSLSALEALHSHAADAPAQQCAACFVVDGAVAAPASEAPSLSRIEVIAPVACAHAAVRRDASCLAPSARGPPLSWS